MTVALREAIATYLRWHDRNRGDDYFDTDGRRVRMALDEAVARAEGDGDGAVGTLIELADSAGAARFGAGERCVVTIYCHPPEAQKIGGSLYRTVRIVPVPK